MGKIYYSTQVDIFNFTLNI